ncbi:hypothetical protein OK074_3443 [Actinobacteria bacterium OK074]|nr:hypothetical protein OK074_3443 [Actinobacteria bacterium OK074]
MRTPRKPPTSHYRPLSPHCEVAKRPGYEDLHTDCTQTKDVPTPGESSFVPLVRRCTCPCHHQPITGGTP